MQQFGKIERDFMSLLNVLALLREKPMTYEEMMKSSCFESEEELDLALGKLVQARCIEKIKDVKIYCILGYGITFFGLYPTWRPLPVKVLDIMVRRS